MAWQLKSEGVRCGGAGGGIAEDGQLTLTTAYDPEPSVCPSPEEGQLHVSLRENGMQLCVRGRCGICEVGTPASEVSGQAETVGAGSLSAQMRAHWQGAVAMAVTVELDEQNRQLDSGHVLLKMRRAREFWS